MNSVNLVGRLTRDPELRYGQSGTGYARFTIAVDRPFKKDGQPDADFIPVLTFGKTSEACANYLKKGRLCSVSGSWQTGNYDNNEGKKVYTHECVADNVRFLESNRSESNQSSGQASTSNAASNDPFKDDGRPIDISSDDLPF